MADRVLPIVRLVVVCERVEETNGKLVLIQPLHGVSMRSSGRMEEVAVYVQLTGAVGEYLVSVQLRLADREIKIGASDPCLHEFPADHRAVSELCFRLKNVPFPKPDLYEFVVLANHKELEPTALFRVEGG